MSVEFYLVSEKGQRSAWIASDSLSGMRFWGKEEAAAFLEEALKNYWDVTLVNEDQLEALVDAGRLPETEA